MKSDLTLGRLVISPPVLLAPLAGVTDVRFRGMVRGFGGCGLSYTELVSVEGAVRKQTRTLALMERAPGERPFGIQLYGARPEAMEASARIAEEAGADLVDINAGCPARKVVRSRGGAFLLTQPRLLETILRRVRAAVSVPLTLKIRSGFTEKDLNFREIGRLAEDCGVDAVTLHPRTRAQMFTGHADWDHIAELKALLKVPVIGNGDVFTPEDAARMVAQTGCDAVMIGRGIMRNPYLIAQTARHLSGEPYTPASTGDLLAICRDLAGRAVNAELPAVKVCGEMKKYCSWLIHGFPDAARLRNEAFHAKTPAAILALLDALCAGQSGERL
ncbi:MAG: tRNA dihydrouridine synthase DusB [Acidobacteria bacterium]|nr:tRNA dihydrouridine synthase DusB [Acidobacteriota bacterium]